MKRRQGHTYKIFDGGKFTIAIGGDYICDGGHRTPDVTVHYRQTVEGDKIRHRKVRIPLPYVQWRHLYRARRFGGLLVAKLQGRFYHRLCKA